MCTLLLEKVVEVPEEPQKVKMVKTDVYPLKREESASDFSEDDEHSSSDDAESYSSVAEKLFYDE